MILAVFFSVVIFVGLGAVIAIRVCSSHPWCPYYIRKQLISYYKNLKKQKKMGKVLWIEKPPEGGKVA
jgi:hypothetical protein